MLQILATLSTEFADCVENQRQKDAQQDAGGKREVESRVLAPVNDVAGQASQGHMGAAEKGQEQAGHNQRDAENNECFADFRHRSKDFALSSLSLAETVGK
jgi:hypothetical protein